MWLQPGPLVGDVIGPCHFSLCWRPRHSYHRQRGLRHKKLTDWARQMILQLRRWLPQRPLVLVGDSSYAVLDLLHCCQSLAQPVTLIGSCAWTPPFMNRRQHVSRAGTVGLR